MSALKWWHVSLHLRWVGARRKTRPGDAVDTVSGFFHSFRPSAVVPVAFHAATRNLWTTDLIPGRELILDVSIADTLGEAGPNSWVAALHERVGQGSSGFELLSVGAPSAQSINTAAPLDMASVPEEICLRFLSPLPFVPDKHYGQTYLTSKQFLDLLTRRLKLWFGVNVGREIDAIGLTLLTGFWHFEQTPRVSSAQREQAKLQAQSTDSEPFESELLKGCRGPLVLRGNIARLLPYLRAVEQIHLGRPQAINGRGFFRIESPMAPLLDNSLGDVEPVREIVELTVRINDGAPAVDPDDGIPLSNEALATSVADALASGNYTPQPNERFSIRKENGDDRPIERLTTFDAVAQRRLLGLVGPSIDAALSPSSVAYRKNYSREDAIGRVRDALARGYRFAVCADIDEFFPSIRHDQLLRKFDLVLPRCDETTRRLIARVVAGSYIENGVVSVRTTGLAQGSPLSPALANLYLNDFDHALTDAKFEMVRYADDFVLLTRTAQEAETVLTQVRQLLGDEGLALNEAKTQVHKLADGFEFLGEHVTSGSHDDPLITYRAQRKPLLVTEAYTQLGVNGDAFDIRRNGELIGTVPVRRVSELIVLSRASLSTALIEKCARFGIPLAVAMPTGYQLALFAPNSRNFHEAAHRQASRYEATSEQDRTAIAGAFVEAKVDNYCNWIRSNYSAGDSALLERLEKWSKETHAAPATQTLRGYEGAAARACFAWLRERIRPDQREVFNAKRRGRGAPDRLNSILNFGYYLLFMRISGLLRTAGCNPYLGYLHDGVENYETLVCDLQEVFRVHVDRTVLRLINRRELRIEDFNDAPGNYRLNASGIHKVANAWEQTLGSPCREGLLRDIMTAQVRAIRDFVTAGKPLWLYRWTGASRRNDSIDDDERGESDERISEAGAPIVADAEASTGGRKRRCNSVWTRSTRRWPMRFLATSSRLLMLKQQGKSSALGNAGQTPMTTVRVNIDVRHLNLCLM